MLCRLVNYWLLFMYSPWSLYYYLFFSKSLQDGRRAPHSFHCPEEQRGSNTLPGVTEGIGWDGSEASPVPRPCLETSFWDKEPKTRCGSFNSPSPMSVLPTLGFGFQMTQNRPRGSLGHLLGIRTLQGFEARLYEAALTCQ